MSAKAVKPAPKDKKEFVRPKESARPAASKPAAPESPESRPVPRTPIPVPRLKLKYVNELRPKLMQDLQLQNIHQVPRLVKIVLNSGLGEGTKDFKVIEEMARDIASRPGTDELE